MKLTLLSVILFFTILSAKGQAPTSLQYPSTNVFGVNQENVFLSPTVVGNINSYSISPALPAGLSFNTSTGIISGIPTAATANTNYTITATNASGFATATISLQTVNFYYNNAGTPISFLAAYAVPKVVNGSSGTGGQTPGDIVLYTNVDTIGGQIIDCYIKTIAITNVGSWDAYDQSAASGTFFSSNNDAFFSPQVDFSAAGSITFEFQFILGGSYNNGTNTGTNVYLQNLYINTYDIDGNGSSIQHNEFTGFSTSELGTTTNEVVSYITGNASTRFTSNTATNTVSVTDPKNRIRINYGNVSNFRFTAGANGNGLAFFFLDGSAGPSFTTTSTSAPSIDLNTITSGVNNSNSGCGSALSFSGGTSQSNIASTTDLSEFTLQFPTSSILNGANEKLKILGASSGGTIALNFANAASIPNVTLSTITYAVTATVTGGISKLSFVRTSGSTFTLARAEGLIDSLQYLNIATTPTNGDRPFTVNLRNTLYISPDAIFTATLNCVSISGNIYHDANALTDNTVNPNSTTGQFADGTLYAILVKASDSTVLDKKPISSSAYNFGTVIPGKYLVLFSNTTTPTTGSVFYTSTFPSGGYVATGENLGSGVGNDLGVDGRLILTIGNVTITNANFGLQVPPVSTATNQASSLNPGGFNAKTITGTNFGATDIDGTVSSITITNFPSNTNYLKIGSTLYINGGTCPPQSTCTTWPGSVTIPYSAGAPTSAISVDPIDGAVTVTVNYIATDNGNATSNTASIQVPFTVLSTPLAVSGNVWNDGNGNAIKDGTESLTNAANSAQTLYAILVQKTNTYSGALTVYTTTPINTSTGYIFPDVPSGNDYEVRIMSLSTAPINGSALSLLTPALATGYTGVSTNNNGTKTTGLDTNNLINTLPSFNASVPNVNFGIERRPTANDTSHIIPHPSYNTSLALTVANGVSVLTGTDAEDGAKGNGSRVKITDLTGMNGNELRYHGIVLTTGTTIPSYDPTLLTIKFTGGGSNAANFKFVFLDSAGISGPTPSASYTVSWGPVLPVTLISFDASLVNNKVKLKWKTENESFITTYNVQRSANAVDWRSIANLPAASSGIYESEDATPLNSISYYRLQIISANGNEEYSAIHKMINTNDQRISIRPNPVTTTLTVDPGNTGLNKIELVNNSGQIVLSKMALGITDINVKHIPAGIYDLRIISSEGKISTLKVSKK